MPGSSLGQQFRITTFGESHGPGIGVVIEGVPGGFAVDLGLVQAALDRRRPGQSAIVTQRKELDRVEVLSGLFEGRATGAPLTLWIKNQDADARAYEPFKDIFRPSHADYTYFARYNHRDWRGGGRASARETAARVAAGAVAAQLLPGVEVRAWVESVGEVSMGKVGRVPSLEEVEASPVRCPDPGVAEQLVALIREVRAAGDTVGGVVRGVATGVPVGLGEPVFEKLEAELAKGMLSIPAARGFEIGSGFAGTRMRGSEHNDAFYRDSEGKIRTRSNHAGGTLGGFSSGMPLEFGVAFKPVATIFQEQESINIQGESVVLMPRGRHDPCVVPRAVPIVEAMVWLTLVDFWLRKGPDRR